MKPVAWMLTLPDGTHDWILDGQDCDGYIPLYTTPQTKPLSDEEIIKASEPFWKCDAFNEVSFDDVGFARAILKKASKK